MSNAPCVPLFSVVICTYNRAGLLPRAVASVLAQTDGDFELVVLDDGSTDDTADVVGAIRDSRVRYVRQENQGLSVGRNTGVAHSSGRYVLFLDDDDLALPNWLERLGVVVRDDCAHDGCAVVCCGEVLVEEDGRIVETKMPGPLGPAFADFSGHFVAGTFAVRPDVYAAVGGFHPGLPHIQHTEFALRLLAECRARGWTVRTIDEALVHHHIGGPRRIGLANIGSIHLAMDYVLERHGAQLALSPQLLARFSTVAGVAAAQTGDYPAARRHLRRAVRTRPREWKLWARLALASVPPVGRLVWGRHFGGASSLEPA